MPLVHSEEEYERERNMYFDEMTMQQTQEKLKWEHEAKMARQKYMLTQRYRTIEKIVVSIAKLIPYTVCIVAIWTLALVQRPAPKILEDFLSS